MGSVTSQISAIQLIASSPPPFPSSPSEARLVGEAPLSGCVAAQRFFNK